MKQLIALFAVTLTAAACNCSHAPSKPTLLLDGEPCTTDDECETGLCEPLPGAAPVCRAKCAGGCVTGEVCEQLTPGRFSCVMDMGGLCTACAKDSDCPYPADKCLVVDNEHVCGRDCAFDQKCPTSYQCVNGVGLDGNARAQQCTPTSGSCLCTAASTGQMISCQVQNNFGTCAGHRTCDGLNGYGACDARTPGVETCNGIDDNCNGTTDEGLGMTTCGLGICQRTVNACIAGSPGTCTPGNPATEICNGLDDDCDGIVDNGFNLMGDVSSCGTCNHVCSLPNATPVCDLGACKVGACATGFGNCDQLDPNGCEKDLTQDPNNCNACGHVCTFANAAPSCSNGVCGFTCLPGYIDLDQNPANGCEYACTFQSMTDLPDMAFTDSNCDGIDGELTNGIFVAPVTAGGNDANPGTRTLPKATVAGALAAATTQGKRDVYVAAGTYAGQLTVASAAGKFVAGGYSASDWKRSLINTTTFANGNPALKVSAALNDTLQFITFLGGNASNGGSSYAGWVESSAGITLEAVSLFAGNGGDGVDAAGSGSGASGNTGGVGNLGCTNDPDFGPFICSLCAVPVVGAQGTSACGELGGVGGAPGWTTDAPDGLGHNGGPGSGGALGGIGTGPESGSNAPGGAANGQNGADGAPGGNGDGGTAIGSLDAGSGYVPSMALAGVAGTNGKGGGGGGGGGGGCASSILGIFCYCYSYGSSGGGGGGGGCAGPAGAAGGSGGASIGLLLLDSTVTATNVAISTASGGHGGKGAAGGSGGNGGPGSDSSVDTGQQGDSGKGGKGGNGGTGGNGGHGGGGGGGPSIGVARTSGSGFTVNNVSYMLGSWGTPGTSPGSAGQQGTPEQIHVF